MIEKIKESAVSVTPIAAIVLLLCLCIIPTEAELLLAFLVGAAFIILGMGLFSIGREQSMTPIGNKIGTALMQMITELLSICPSNIQEFCKTLRNNIHYERQEYLLLYDELPLFEELFTICKKLVANIRKILNIKPSKAKLCYYKFLKWIQE